MEASAWEGRDGRGSKCMGGPQSAWKRVYARAVMGKKDFVKGGGACAGMHAFVVCRRVCASICRRGAPSAPSCPAGVTAAAAAAAAAVKSFSPPLSMKLLCTHTP